MFMPLKVCSKRLHWIEACIHLIVDVSAHVFFKSMESGVMCFQDAFSIGFVFVHRLAPSIDDLHLSIKSIQATLKVVVSQGIDLLFETKQSLRHFSHRSFNAVHPDSEIMDALVERDILRIFVLLSAVSSTSFSAFITFSASCRRMSVTPWSW